jgi:hypothetical protein
MQTTCSTLLYAHFPGTTHCFREFNIVFTKWMLFTRKQYFVILIAVAICIKHVWCLNVCLFMKTTTSIEASCFSVNNRASKLFPRKQRVVITMIVKLKQWIHVIRTLTSWVITGNNLYLTVLRLPVKHKARGKFRK